MLICYISHGKIIQPGTLQITNTSALEKYNSTGCRFLISQHCIFGILHCCYFIQTYSVFHASYRHMGRCLIGTTNSKFGDTLSYQILCKLVLQRNFTKWGNEMLICMLQHLRIIITSSVSLSLPFLSYSLSSFCLPHSPHHTIQVFIFWRRDNECHCTEIYHSA